VSAAPGRARGEQPVVPRATFGSYFGRPVLKPPTWKARNIAGYFFLGGLAAGSSLLAAVGDVTGRASLRRVGRLSAAAAITGSMAALIDDLGRPARFLHMLRVLRPTSPMSVGSWLLAAYGPLAGAAAAGEVTGVRARLPGLGAAALAPAVATYTAVILSDTAVPTWHEARRELPFVFAGSAAAAAGGVAMTFTPVVEAGPARRLAASGAALELLAAQVLERRLGLVGEPLRTGRAGRLLRVATLVSAGGAVLGTLGGRRSRAAAALGGTAMAVGSACTRFGIFYAGVAAAEDPELTVVPQRARLDADGQHASA